MASDPPSPTPPPSAANLAQLLRGQFARRGLDTVAQTRKEATDQIMENLAKRSERRPAPRGPLPVFDPEDGDLPSFGTEGYTVNDVIAEERLTVEQQLAQIALAVRKGHEPGRSDINWYEVKLLYIGGWTLEEIAERCNISLSWVKEKSRTQNWVLQREEHQRSLASLAEAKIAEAEQRWIDEHEILRRDLFLTLRMASQAVRDAMSGKASLGDLAKIIPILDQLGVSVTGASSVFSNGGPSVTVNNQTAIVNPGAQAYPPGSIQATVLEVLTMRDGESEDDMLRRFADWVRAQHDEFDRMDFYADHKLTGDDRRRLSLGNRLPALRAPDVIEMPVEAGGAR